MPDVQDFINAKEHFAAQGRSLLKRLEERADTIPLSGTVYHYTNDEGLRGILESGTLWASNIFKLNDPSEVTYGLDKLIRELDKLSADDGVEVRDFVDSMRRFVGEGITEAGRLFACSLSADGDDLGQWRAYGDNGCGFAVGFDADALTRRFRGEGLGNGRAFRVSYRGSFIEEAHRSLAEMALQTVRSIETLQPKPDRREAYRRMMAAYLSLFAMEASLLFKHPAYDNEREFRLLEVHPTGLNPPPEGLKRRARRYGIIEYLELDWRSIDPVPLKMIRVGPANREAGMQFARDRVRAAGLDAEVVVPSLIPYRTG